MKQKMLKIITVVICSLLALVLLLTMFLPAFAAESEQGQFTYDDGGTGVLMTLDESKLIEDLEGVKLNVKVIEIKPGDEGGEYEMLAADEKFSGRRVLKVYTSELTLAQYMEKYDLAEGTAIIPGAFTESIVHDIPGGDEYRRYEDFSVSVYAYSVGSLADAKHSIERINGERYVEIATETWAYIILSCKADESGEAVTLPFYKVGFIGFLYEIRMGLLVGVIGIALLALFVRKPKPRPVEDVDDDTAVEQTGETPTALEETTGEVAADDKKE